MNTQEKRVIPMTTAAPQLLVPDEDGVLSPVTGLVIQTNDEYHAGPGISKSHLDTINGRSARHYWHKYLNPNRVPKPPSDEMIFGSAVHVAVLEPDLLSQEVVESPGFNRRTKAGKAEWEAFCEEHKGKIVLDPDDFARVLGVRDAVYADPLASSLLCAPGAAEQSFYATDPETGELVKCRTDYMLADGSAILDLKTTKDASPDGFGKSCANFRYPVQTAWYHRVLDLAFGEHPPGWAFLAVESEPPYVVGVYFPTPAQIVLAAEAARRDYMRIIAAKRSGQFPGYTPTDPLPISLPGWVKF